MLPSEIFIVQFVVFIEELEVSGEIFGGRKVVYVDEGVRRSNAFVFVFVCSHHDGQNVVFQGVVPEFLTDVLATIAVLEGNVELVFLLQHVQATLSVVAFEVSAETVNINHHIFLQCIDVFLSVVLGFAIGDEPGAESAFRGESRVIAPGDSARRTVGDGGVALKVAFVKFTVLPVGRRNIGLGTVGARPIKDTIELGEIGFGVMWRFQIVKYPSLLPGAPAR